MRPSRTEQIDSLKTAIGRLVQSSDGKDEPRRNIPAPYDVKSTPSEITILVDLPGVDEDEIAIAVESRALKVSADREFDHDNEDAEEYTHIGRAYGAFCCTVALPPRADTDGMTAKYKRGVLKIRIPMEGA